MRRFLIPKIDVNAQKIVIVGIDFGTSFTKVYFNQSGEKQPLKFNVNGKESYFLPTILYYNPKENKLYFHKKNSCIVLKYFKYSMISDELITNKSLKANNKDLNRPEVLCSVYFLAFLIKALLICSISFLIL